MDHPECAFYSDLNEGHFIFSSATQASHIIHFLLIASHACAMQVRKHPDNDISIINCSRCGCPPHAHEMLIAQQEQVC